MNITFKDWKELPLFTYGVSNMIDGGRWSYRNGGFKDGDIGVWYIVNIVPVLTTQKHDYTYYVYQLPPTICHVINSMVAESHNEVIDMVLAGMPKRMDDNGLGYVEEEEE